MSLSFQKYVVMTNPRLRRFYHITMLFLGAMLALRFYYAGQWMRKVDLYDQVIVTMWVDGFTNAALLENQWADARDSPLCTSPENYDFWYDDTWKFVNHTCLQPCVGTRQADCATIADRFVQESPSSVMLTTSMTEIDPVSGNLKSWLLPTVDSLAVSFSYNYRVPKPNMITVDEGIGHKPNEVRGSSKTDTLTVLLRQDRSIDDIIPPSNRISLSVEKMMALAGMTNGLDEQQPDFAKNEMEGDLNGQGPMGRVSGMEFDLEVHCFNTHQMEIHYQWDGPICYVMMHRHNAMWATTMKEAPAASNDNINEFNLYRGIRVSAKSKGYFVYTDLNIIYLNLVAAVVIMSLPKRVFLFIATRLLGHLSVIYRRVIFERFSIGEQVGGMASRLMATSATFLDLEEHDDQGGISKDRLVERIAAITEYRARVNQAINGDGEIKISDVSPQFLDPRDLGVLTNFAFQSIVDPTWYVQWDDEHRLWRFFNKFAACRVICRYVAKAIKMFAALAIEDEVDDGGPEDKMAGVSKRVAPERINIDMFMGACSNHEHMGFVPLVKLFNHRRRRSCLERFFTPKYLQEFFDSQVDRTTLEIVSDAVDASRGLEPGESRSASKQSRGMVASGGSADSCDSVPDYQEDPQMSYGNGSGGWQSRRSDSRVSLDSRRPSRVRSMQMEKNRVAQELHDLHQLVRMRHEELHQRTAAMEQAAEEVNRNLKKHANLHQEHQSHIKEAQDKHMNAMMERLQRLESNVQVAATSSAAAPAAPASNSEAMEMQVQKSDSLVENLRRDIWVMQMQLNAQMAEVRKLQGRGNTPPNRTSSNSNRSGNNSANRSGGKSAASGNRLTEETLRVNEEIHRRAHEEKISNTSRGRSGERSGPKRVQDGRDAPNGRGQAAPSDDQSGHV